MIERIGLAERLVALGSFARAGEQLAALAPELAAIHRPDLLARAAWVASICSLAGQRIGEFEAMVRVAAEAVELAIDGEVKNELAAIARRIGHLARIGTSSNPDAAVREVLHDHVVLLAKAASDPAQWFLVDADRSDWPHLFAAIREQTGTPCSTEALIAGADTDGIGAVIIAVSSGLGAGVSYSANDIARICFRESATVEIARRRIDELIEAGILVRAGDGRVALAADS